MGEQELLAAMAELRKMFKNQAEIAKARPRRFWCFGKDEAAARSLIEKTNGLR